LQNLPSFMTKMLEKLKKWSPEFGSISEILFDF
jgi:hypothetical protein